MTPGFTLRCRGRSSLGSLVLSAAGAVALFGLPGVVAPMRVGVDSLDYVDPDLAIHRDMVWFRKNVAGLNVARVWVRTPPGAAVDPEVLRGVDRFATAVEAIPRVSVRSGPTTFLRMRRYMAGAGGPAAPGSGGLRARPPPTWSSCCSPRRSCAASSTWARWPTPSSP